MQGAPERPAFGIARRGLRLAIPLRILPGGEQRRLCAQRVLADVRGVQIHAVDSGLGFIQGAQLGDIFVIVEDAFVVQGFQCLPGGL